MIIYMRSFAKPLEIKATLEDSGFFCSVWLRSAGKELLTALSSAAAAEHIDMKGSKPPDGGAERGFREAEIQTLVFQKEEKQS